MKFKWKLLWIKCHVLEFIKDEAQKMLQKIIQSFAEAFVSHDKHTLFALEESGLLRWPAPTIPNREPSPHRSGSFTDSPHRRHRKEEDPHLHINKKIIRAKSLSDYAQQDLSVVMWRPQNLDMQRLQVK
jgi:hypothetical protein